MTSRRQFTQELDRLLRARKWGGDANNDLVWGTNVFRTPGGVRRVLEEDRSRNCLVQFWWGKGDADNDQVRLSEDELNIRIFVFWEADHTGKLTMVGRRADVTKTKGVGILEVEPELKAVLRALSAPGNPALDFHTFQDRTIADVERPPQDGVSRQYTVSVLTTEQPYYHPHSRLRKTGSVASTSLDLKWFRPHQENGRFDYVDQTLVWKAGTSAPADVTDGTEVDLDFGDETKTITVGTTPVSVALFAGYDYDGDGVADDWTARHVKENITV